MLDVFVACLSVRPSVCLPVCLFVFMYVRMYVRSIHLLSLLRHYCNHLLQLKRVFRSGVLECRVSRCRILAWGHFDAGSQGEDTYYNELRTRSPKFKTPHCVLS